MDNLIFKIYFFANIKYLTIIYKFDF